MRLIINSTNNIYEYHFKASEEGAHPAMLLALAEKMAKISRKNLAALELNAGMRSTVVLF